MLTKEEVLKRIKEGSGDALKGASVFLGFILALP